jgi:hypothetical protein
LKESLLVTASEGVSRQRTHVQLLYLVLVEARSTLKEDEEKDKEEEAAKEKKELKKKRKQKKDEAAK